MGIKGYKVFNPDWTCRGFQYKVGKTFKHDGDIEMCGKGFHFCQKAADCFNYYSFNSDNKVAEVEAVGIVETEDDKSVTDELRIVREVSWQELLTMVNTGRNCTGLNNTGDRNTGDCNTGCWNTGDWNTGGWNTGCWNTGDCNTGNRNTGDRNTGCWNTGDWNTGCWNTGCWNTGDRNTGDCNTGNRNTGDRNTGCWNTGCWNTGDRNTGDRNTGDWNSCDCSTGFFCSHNRSVDMFNNATEFTREDVFALKGVQVLNCNYENNWWIYSDSMTDDEKQAHPEHETTGGYLKSIPFKAACLMMWKKLDDDDKQSVFELPNFDPDVFYEITGIDVTKDDTFTTYTKTN